MIKLNQMIITSIPQLKDSQISLCDYHLFLMSVDCLILRFLVLHISTKMHKFLHCRPHMMNFYVLTSYILVSIIIFFSKKPVLSLSGLFLLRYVLVGNTYCKYITYKHFLLIYILHSPCPADEISARSVL